MATLYKTDGTKEAVFPANGTDFTLAELQGYVGGLIDIVWVLDGKSELLVVNDEGLIHGLPFNKQASEFADGLHIVGDAVRCSQREVK